MYDRYLAFQCLPLLSGLRTHLVPHIQISEGVWATLEHAIWFEAEPPLPEGLFLHRSSGAISGVPSQTQEILSLHTITARILATCVGGISLGCLPLTSCQIGIRIVDARRFELAWTQDATMHGNEHHFAFRVQATP